MSEATVAEVHATPTGEPASKHNVSHGGAAHAVPVWMLGAIFLALVGLTILTVSVSVINIGKYDLPVAMLIATVKGLMVALVFMHLRWDRGFNGIVFILSFVFLGLFLMFATTDTHQYESDIERHDAAVKAGAGH